MSFIGPKLTQQALEKSGKQTMKGLGSNAGLPGVKTDALQMDPIAYKKNREFAKRISEAVIALKSDEDGSHFILAWRMYPNNDHPRWQQEEHVCGCSHGGVVP